MIDNCSLIDWNTLLQQCSATNYLRITGIDMDGDGSFACVELKELCDIAADEEDCRNLLTEYVLQNAYHPSILCWKLPEDHADFAALLRELDSTRPVLF